MYFNSRLAFVAAQGVLKDPRVSKKDPYVQAVLEVNLFLYAANCADSYATTASYSPMQDVDLFLCTRVYRSLDWCLKSRILFDGHASSLLAPYALFAARFTPF
jgi:hypothetical protein